MSKLGTETPGTAHASCLWQRIRRHSALKHLWEAEALHHAATMTCFIYCVFEMNILKFVKSKLRLKSVVIFLFYSTFKCFMVLFCAKLWSAASRVFRINASRGLDSGTVPIALLADLWWNPCAIFSEAKRCTKKPSSSSAEQTLPLYQGSPPLLSMKGCSDEVASLAFTGATVCPSAAKQSPVCPVAPNIIIFPDNRNYPATLISINHRLVDCCLSEDEWVPG